MAELDQIIPLSITRQTQSIATASFQIPLVLSETVTFPERTKQYTGMDSLEEDFQPGTTVHTIGSQLFGQEVRPPLIIVGRRDDETETWAEALSAVTEDNSEWYALIAEARDPDDQFELAALIQSREKIFATATSSSEAVDEGAVTDIGYRLEAAGYDRTFVVYSTNADTQFPEAAWVGSQLPRTPGSNDWIFKSVTGVTPDKISDTQRAVLREKGYNMYTTIGGVSIFQDGNMADGTPIDEIIFVDWLKARMQEGVYFRLINTLKVPFTRAGFTIIENEMRTVLAQGVANGGLASNPAPTVTSPDPLAVPAAQRAQRIGGTFSFSGRLAGSMRKIIIEGTLTV